MKVIPLAFGFIAIVLAVLSLLQGIKEVRIARSARGWLATAATIVEGTFVPISVTVGRARRTEFMVKLVYQYRASAILMTGTSIRSDNMPVTFLTPAAANRYIDSLRANAALQAWVDPENPSRAVLERGKITGIVVSFWTALFLGVLGAFAVFIGLPA